MNRVHPCRKRHITGYVTWYLYAGRDPGGLLVLQSKLDQGGADGRRPVRRRKPMFGRPRRSIVFPALVMAVLLVGAGVTGAWVVAVGFIGGGSGQPVVLGAAAVNAAASALSASTLEREAAALLEPDGPAVPAVMPTRRTHPKAKAKGSAPGGGASGGTITTGDSKAHCITLTFPGGVLDQSMISAATALTGVTYNCLETYANPMQTWEEWETPWMFSTVSDGWDAWLAASSAHQVVMSMDLIPQEVSNNGDPLSWEQPCAAGDYNQYATALAQNLVSYGAGNIVIRLGTEANGAWEADYVGTTSSEMSDWAQCFDNEVSAMRAVSGAHLLFVWNPNVCTLDIPINQWYPGNAYVDIMGVDAYDADCGTLQTVGQEGWTAYSTDSSSNGGNDPDFPSLVNMEAFAAANGKPLSFPEWGLGSGDDPAYVTNMGQMFSSDDFSFESYFDTNNDGIAALGSAIPNATAAYAKAF